MPKINKQELTHLEQLANVKIDKSQEWPFLEKLDSIIDKLDELNKFDTNWEYTPKYNTNPLRTISRNREFEWKKEILDNVKHEVINNSIVIKSALSD
jgi:aspartyl/glutamyl-tRNA(Asn/Gln) amidotransferase C subunit